MSKLAISAAVGVSAVSGLTFPGTKDFLGFLQNDVVVQPTLTTAVKTVNGIECAHINFDGADLCVMAAPTFDLPGYRDIVKDAPPLAAQCPEDFRILGGYKLRLSEKSGEPLIEACTNGEQICKSDGDMDMIWMMCAAPIHRTREVPRLYPIVSQGGSKSALECKQGHHMAFGFSFRVAEERVVYSVEPCGGLSGEYCPAGADELTGDRLSFAFCSENGTPDIPFEMVTSGSHFAINGQQVVAQADLPIMQCATEGYFSAVATVNTASSSIGRDCYVDNKILAMSADERRVHANKQDHSKRIACNLDNSIPYPYAIGICGANAIPKSADEIAANIEKLAIIAQPEALPVVEEAVVPEVEAAPVEVAPVVEAPAVDLLPIKEIDAAVAGHESSADADAAVAVPAILPVVVEDAPVVVEDAPLVSKTVEVVVTPNAEVEAVPEVVIAVETPVAADARV